ncbi:HU family DNA-binding protein [Candidatus Magnetominusculus dajiuhuensis]|uniref:HU family DNA-binding protein n=1 Tax=Candidatus Magnetominusculus dajiuhuensis TaxID=3137712 RepID=UPI0019EAB9C2|nr:HU family DNA-binding protein [Nitrospirota bacterium]
MTKAELIDRVAVESKVSKTEVAKVISGTFDAISKALKDGERVILVGFGTFVVSERNARTGRNPKTGEATLIPAAKVPKFRAGKGLKDVVSGVK